MRRSIPCLIAALAATPALPLPAVAGPLDLTEIPRDAAAVIHIDFEACLASPTLGEAIREMLSGSSEIEIEGMKSLEDLDLDLAATLLDVTVIAEDVGNEDGVVRLRTTDGIDALLERLQDEGELTMRGRRGEWSFGGVDDEGAIAVRRRGRTRTILLGESPNHLVDLLEATRGFAGSPPPRGTLAYLAVRDLDAVLGDADLPPGVGAARSAVAWIADLEGGALGANLRVTMSDDDAAASVMAVAQGGLALIRLGDPELAEMTNAVALSCDGSTVAVSLRIPGELLEAIVEGGPSDLGDFEELMEFGRAAQRRDTRGERRDRDRRADRRRDADRDRDLDMDMDMDMDTPRRDGARAEAARARAEAAAAEARLRALEGALRQLESKLDELIEADAPEAVIDGLRRAIDELRAEIGEVEEATASSAVAPTPHAPA